MLCEGKTAAVPNDDVVEDPHIHERERFLESPRDQLISLAWLCHAGRVIVGHNLPIRPASSAPVY